MSSKQTPSQTVGPYFAYGLTPAQYGYGHTSAVQPVVGDDGTPGERIRLVGCVFDGAGDVIPDAMIEIWQAGGDGRYPHGDQVHGPNTGFTGFGRSGTGMGEPGEFVFETIKPGATEDGQAPHISVIVFMRGLLSHAYTRVYFADEADANDNDPVLSAVPPERRGTLLAQREDAGKTVIYRFDIHMQGDRETVFFDV